MADELDPRLEARLRTTLRAEADALPFTIRADQVADRLAERRRASDRRRLAVVAAAAVFAVGAAAFGLSLSRNLGPAATPSPPLPELLALPSYADLLAQADGPVTVLGQAEGVAADDVVLADATGHEDLELLYACSTNAITLRVVGSDGPTYLEGPFTCTGQANAEIMTNGTMDEAPSLRAVVSAAPGVAWRAVLVAPTFPSASPEPAASLAADCVATDDPGTVPALDFVDGTGALITSGEIVYAWGPDGFTTGDPDGWVVPADAAPASLDNGLGLDAGDACVVEWSIRVAPTADVASAIDAGIDPLAEAYVVSPATEGGHALTFNEMPPGDVLVRVAATWYSTQPTAPVTARVYRLLNEAGLPEPTATVPADAEPSLPGPLPGESTLFELPIEGGAAPDELSAEIPAGTDAFNVTLDCIGSGTVTLDIDGVVWSFPCEGMSVTAAARGADDLLEVTASAEGSLRALVRLAAFDMQRIPDATFVPPALRLTGPDATAGDQVSVRGYVGCGLSYEPKGGVGGFGDECGPSWAPIPTALRQQPGTSVSFELGGGWDIVEVEADTATHDDILPARDPASTPLAVRREGQGYVFDVPSPGDWGVRLRIRAEKDGASFSVPYYTRVSVPSEP